MSSQILHSVAVCRGTTSRFLNAYGASAIRSGNGGIVIKHIEELPNADDAWIMRAAFLQKQRSIDAFFPALEHADHLDLSDLVSSGDEWGMRALANDATSPAASTHSQQADAMLMTTAARLSRDVRYLVPGAQGDFVLVQNTYQQSRWWGVVCSYRGEKIVASVAARLGDAIVSAMAEAISIAANMDVDKAVAIANSRVLGAAGIGVGPTGDGKPLPLAACAAAVAAQLAATELLNPPGPEAGQELSDALARLEGRQRRR